MAALSPRANVKTQASTPDIANIASPELNDPLDSTEDTSSYPDASLFTFLPDLYLVISRLSLLKNPPSSSVDPTQAPTSNSHSHLPSQTQSSATVQGDSNNHSANPLTQTISRESQASGSSLRPTSSRDEPGIDVRDLPTQIYGIKQGIARAKAVVRDLPDGQRSVEEQEKEMRELRMHIRGLQGRLGELGRTAGGQASRDVEMQGIKG